MNNIKKQNNSYQYSKKNYITLPNQKKENWNMRQNSKIQQDTFILYMTVHLYCDFVFYFSFYFICNYYYSEFYSFVGT